MRATFYLNLNLHYNKMMEEALVRRLVLADPVYDEAAGQQADPPLDPPLWAGGGGDPGLPLSGLEAGGAAGCGARTPVGPVTGDARTGGQTTPSLLLQPAGAGPPTPLAGPGDRPEPAPVPRPAGGAAGEGPGGPGGHLAVHVLEQ